MFFSLQIDRGNISQAVSGTLLQDLKLNINGEHTFIVFNQHLTLESDFNFGNTVFLVSFLLFELPSQLISKKFGPDRWIPTQMVLWSIVAMSQAAVKTRSTFLLTRALLGVLEVSCSCMPCKYETDMQAGRIHSRSRALVVVLLHQPRAANQA